MPDIIIKLGLETEVTNLANTINKKYCGSSAQILTFQNASTINNHQSIQLFLLGHANAMKIGNYDYLSLMHDFGQFITNTQNLYLAGCSTHDANAQVLPNGFVAKSLAQNIQQAVQNRNITVYGTPGTLVLDTLNNELYIKFPPGLSMSAALYKDKIFVAANLLP